MPRTAPQGTVGVNMKRDAEPVGATTINTLLRQHRVLVTKRATQHLDTPLSLTLHFHATFDTHHAIPTTKVFFGSLFSTMVTPWNRMTIRALHIQALFRQGVLALSVGRSGQLSREKTSFKLPPELLTTAHPLKCSRHRRSAGTGLPLTPCQIWWRRSSPAPTDCLTVSGKSGGMRFWRHLFSKCRSTCHLRVDVSAVADLQLAKIKAAISLRDGGGDRGLDVATQFDDTMKHHIAQCARSHSGTKMAVATSGNELASTKALTSRSRLHGAPWKPGGRWLWSLG